MNRPLRHVVPLALSLALLAPLPGVAMADQPRKGEQAHGPQRDNDRQHGQDRASTPRPAKARDPVHLEPQQRESLRRWQDGHPGWQRPVPPDVARGLAVHRASAHRVIIAGPRPGWSTFCPARPEAMPISPSAAMSSWR